MMKRLSPSSYIICIPSTYSSSPHNHHHHHHRLLSSSIIKQRYSSSSVLTQNNNNSISIRTTTSSIRGGRRLLALEKIGKINLKSNHHIQKASYVSSSFTTSSATATATATATSSTTENLDHEGRFIHISPPVPIIPDAVPTADSSILSTYHYNPYDIVEESLAVMSANLRLGDPHRAELIFQKLWRSNFGNFRSKVNIQTLNALIEGYLMLNESSASTILTHVSQRKDTEKALFLYSNLSKYSLSPDIDTFSILIYHFSRTSDLDSVTKLFQEMKTFGFSPCDLTQHHLFDNPEDLLQLKTVFRQLGVKEKVIAETSPDEELMFSVLEDGHLRTNHPNNKHDNCNNTHNDFTENSNYNTKITTSNHFHDYSMPPKKTTTNMNSEISFHHGANYQSSFSYEFGYENNSFPLKEDDSSNSVGVKMLRKTLTKVENFLQDNEEKRRIQELLEEESNRLALMEHDDKLENIPDYLKQMTGVSRSFLRQWHRELVPILRLEMKRINKKKKNSTESIKEFEEFMHLPFFNLLRPEQLSLITILEFLRAPFRANSDYLSGFFGETKAVSLFSRIGMAVEQEANAQYIANRKPSKAKAATDQVYKLHASGKLKDPKLRMAALQIARRKLAKDQSWAPKWPESLLVRVGSVLATWLISVAKIKVKVGDESDPSSFKYVDAPAFEHAIVPQPDMKNVGMVKFNENLLKELLQVDVSVPPRYLPMIVVPRPWIKWRSGGYLTEHVRASMVRTGRHTQHEKYLDAADGKGHMASIYLAIDNLGSTAWRINKMILKVAKECWNDGQAWPCIEPSDPLPEIPKPDNVETDPLVKRQYRRKLIQREKEEKGRYSQRCDAHYKILVANAFKDVPIYFPHYVDFRGRAYPLPVHLNHVGNDLCRGLMLFEKAKPLGETGLRWLKIQLSNLYGVDKVSFAEREGFVEENLANIMDSADKPLEGKRWWLKADYPWQCLATCLELTSALRSPDPTRFLSRLPIHMDGTCNGLQHYAALGGDVIGAKLVNLIPGEKPADIYTGVAQAVSKLIEKDAEEGHPIAQKVNGLISRKVIKQTVMTNTYGVTRIGARMQVQARLKDIVDKHGMDDSEMFRSSIYIVDKVFRSLGEMFEGARSLQLWLNAAARSVASSIPEKSLSEFELKQACWLRDRGLLPSSFTREREENALSSSISEEIQKMNDLESLSLDFNVSDIETDELAEAAVSDMMSSSEEEKMKLNTEKLDAAIDSKNKPTEEKPNDPMKMTSVIWTTPLGLPVVQPYWNFKSRVVKTMLQDITLHDTNTPCPVDVQKQTTAFPPNFIHSLDASHMMLSAIACNTAGLEFAAVHDSYWTHACDIDKMNSILRDAFVRLHKQDLMDRLRNEMLHRYKSHKSPLRIELKGQDLEDFMKFMKANNKKAVLSFSKSSSSSTATTTASANDVHGSSNQVESAGGKSSVDKDKSKTMNTHSKKKVIQTWVDFDLPPLPKKGLFNVEIVRESRYFFH